jgi:hypothetical protein
MSKIPLTVFVCTGKDCAKAWGRFCDGSPGKWLKRHVEAAGLPYKLNVVKTDCMDRCDDAACLCFVHQHKASEQLRVRSASDLGRLLGAMLDLGGQPWRLGKEEGDENRPLMPK